MAHCIKITYPKCQYEQGSAGVTQTPDTALCYIHARHHQALIFKVLVTKVYQWSSLLKPFNAQLKQEACNKCIETVLLNQKWKGGIRLYNQTFICKIIALTEVQWRNKTELNFKHLPFSHLHCLIIWCCYLSMNLIKIILKNRNVYVSKPK